MCQMDGIHYIMLSCGQEAEPKFTSSTKNDKVHLVTYTTNSIKHTLPKYGPLTEKQTNSALPRNFRFKRFCHLEVVKRLLDERNINKMHNN